MKNIFDVVETNKMSMEYDGAKNDVEVIAGEDLENGRLVTVDENGVATYTTDANPDNVFLVTTPEKVYDGGDIDSFYNPKGKKIRVVSIEKLDIYSTTAIEVEFDKNDKLVAGANGLLVKGEEGTIVLKAKGKRLLSKEIGVTVQRIK